MRTLTQENASLSDASKSSSNLSYVWIGLGGLFGLLGVAAGAVGVHALRGSLDPSALGTFETAVRFQIYHALALIGAGILSRQCHSRVADWSGAFFALGVLVFSGSLYALATTGVGFFGALAPVGGLSLMIGWAFIVMGAIRDWRRR